MKRSIALALTTIMAASSVAAVLLTSHQEAIQTNAYTASSLATTIDLNDASESEIRNYYRSLNGQNLNGDNLLIALKDILKNGQKYYSYESKTNIWKMYEIIDRDWKKSPASDLNDPTSDTYSSGTYDAQKNVINNYRYGSSISNHPYGDPYVHALYVNRDVENLTTAWGSHDQDQWGINQEHVWAKSNGFEASGAGGARGDPMHLMAGNGKVNGAYHKNYYFGYVDTSKEYKDAGDEYTENRNLSGNMTGEPLNVDSSKNVFEPQDSDKGDIARSIFYMAARYNYLSGSDTDGIDANNPNLELVADANFTDKGYTSTTSNTGKMGVIHDLLEWNRLDPPDEFEIHRNNLLWRNYTNNRNPFIDFPEWAEYIWGKVTYDGKVKTAHDMTPTGVASPASNIINDFSAGDEASLYLNKTTLSVEEDETATLVATPSKDTVTVNWTTSDANVVTIDKASTTKSDDFAVTLNGVSVGTATIAATATIDEKTFTKTCAITVTEKTQDESGIDVLSPTSLELSGNSYTSWTRVFPNATYNGYSYPRKSYIHINPSQSPSGIVTTVSSAPVSKIEVDWNSATASGRTLEVYGKNTAYTSASDLYSDNSITTGELLGEIVYGTSTSFTLTDDYRYIGLKPKSGASYYNAIHIEYEKPISSISATLSRSFMPGETVTASDITVTDNYGNKKEGFEFTPYMVQYEDGASKELDVSYKGFNATVTVNIEREAFVPYVDVLNNDNVGVSGSTYVNWSGKAFNTDASYSGNTAGSHDSVLMRPTTSNNSTQHSGIINTDSIGNLRKVSITWNSSTSTTSARSLRIFGNADPFSDPNDMYDGVNTAVGTIGRNESTYIFEDEYEYIGITAAGGTIYLDEIKIYYATTAHNIANFIMEEDTANQCESKYDEAKEHFLNLTGAEQSTFMSSEDYVIASARERLIAWAAYHHETIHYIDGDYTFGSYQESLIASITPAKGSALGIGIIAIASIGGVGVYFLNIKRKSKNEA